MEQGRGGREGLLPFFQFVEIGRITSVEFNHKPVDIARKGQEVCIKIEPLPGDAPKMFGRHFDEKDILMSKVSQTWDKKLLGIQRYFTTVNFQLNVMIVWTRHLWTDDRPMVTSLTWRISEVMAVSYTALVSFIVLCNIEQ